MQDKKKLVIIGLAVILTISIFVDFKIYTEKKAIQRERDGLKLENETLFKKIAEAIKEKKQLQEKISALNSDLEKVAQEKEELSKEKDEIQQKYESAAKERDELILEKDTKLKLVEDLKPLKDENAKLKEQLGDLNNQKAKLEAEFDKLQEEKSGLKRQLGEAGISSEGAVDLAPIVVHPQTGLPTIEEKGQKVYIGGSVVSVNKENNFVIIDLGKDAGINIGDTFRVYRQDKSIGAIEVIQVRKNISACDITEETSPIKAGDTIR